MFGQSPIDKMDLYGMVRRNLPYGAWRAAALLLIGTYVCQLPQSAMSIPQSVR